MSRLCKFLGYDLEQGAKAFCMVELVLDYIHVLVSTCVVRLAVIKYFHHVIRSMLFGTNLLFMIGLLLQAVLGWLMYFIGYRKRKVIMFELLMIVAIFNFAIPPVLTVLGFLDGAYEVEDLATEYLAKSVTFVFLYLLYIDFGLATIGAYIKKLLDEKKGKRGDMTGMEAGVTSMEQMGVTIKASMEGMGLLQALLKRKRLKYKFALKISSEVANQANS